MKIKEPLAAPARTAITRLIYASAALLAVVCFCGRDAAAQSALFNVFTTDVMTTGQTYAEVDFDSHLAGYDEGGYQSYGFVVLRGVRRRAEVGLNAYAVRTGAGPAQVEVQPNAKWQAYYNEEKGVAAAAGAVLYLPLNRRSESDTLVSLYATASKTVRGLRGARFTAGGYRLLGQEAGAGGRSGALLGYEQPLSRRLTFIADWNTGKNRFGYAAAGFGVTLPKRNCIYAAYYFGNEGRANNSLGVYYGITF